MCRDAFFSKLSERSRIRIYIRLNDVLSTAELTALPRRSECAASGVAQLQGRRGDHHVQGDPPDGGSARSADPDYKHQYEGGRGKKDKDLISQAKHRAAEYGDNCEYEQQQPRPRMRMPLLLPISLCLLWDRHFPRINLGAGACRTVCNERGNATACSHLSERAQRVFGCGFDDADEELQNAIWLVDTLHLALGQSGIAIIHVNIRQFSPS
jgi:hypothetical protein